MRSTALKHLTRWLDEEKLCVVLGLCSLEQDGTSHRLRLPPKKKKFQGIRVNAKVNELSHVEKLRANILDQRSGSLEFIVGTIRFKWLCANQRRLRV